MPNPVNLHPAAPSSLLESGGTLLHLFRHGAVAQPWPGRVYGRLDVPLSEEGRAQAAWGAASLEGVELASVVSSGLPRAEETAALLRAPRGLARRDEPAFLEICRGDWAGLGPDEIDAHRPGAFQAWKRSGGVLAPPGGETLQHMADRVLPALNGLAEEFAGQRVAIAAHMWVLRIAVSAGLGRPLQRAAGVLVGTGARCDLAWSPGQGWFLLGADAPEGSALTVDGASPLDHGR